MTLQVYLDGTRLFAYHKWEGIRKEEAVAYSKCYPGIDLQTEDWGKPELSQSGARPKLKRAPPPKYKSLGWLVNLCDITVNLAQCFVVVVVVVDDDDNDDNDERVKRLRWEEIIKENRA